MVFYATVLPEEAKQHADSVVIGEVEPLWPQLLRDIESNKLKPFYRSAYMANLKYTPIPRYDLINPKYNKNIVVQVSRGCPHDCDYCAASRIYGKKYRHKTIDQVVEEINLIKKHFIKPRLFFGDDNLFAEKSFSTTLVSEIAKLNIRWHAQSDIAVGNNNRLLTLLEKSGCTFLFIGFESLAEDNLNEIDHHGWKPQQLQHYERHIKNIQEHGIGVMGAFMVGLDNDDISVFNTIADFIISNNLYAASITILTPLPGTRLRERLKKQNRLLLKGWEYYTGYNITFKLNQLTEKEINLGLPYLYKKIFSQEVYLQKMRYFKDIQKNLMSE